MKSLIIMLVKIFLDVIIGWTKMTLIDKLPNGEKFVSMCLFRNKLLVASDKRVYVYYDETHSFHPLQFVELEESNKITQSET